MPFRKVIPIHDKETAQDKLVRAVGRVLAERGFRAVSDVSVAAEAGVDRGLIYRYFGGLRGLISAFAESADFWPSTEELLGGDPAEIETMPPGELMATFFKAYLSAILKRPQTLEILAWEMQERNEISRMLESVRVRTALEFFEHMKKDPPEDVDLTALVAIIAAATTDLAVRSRVNRFFGGIDLRSDKGWERLGRTLDTLFRKTLE
jgi:AcrR family transcriptional regulator